MRFSCQKAFILVFASTIGCHDPAGPATLSAYFRLQTINGRQLPTYLSPTPGPTATIISSSMALDKTGKAVMTEQRQDTFQGEATHTSTLDYRIRGNQIEIGSFEPCPINAICAANMTGTFSSFGLTLIINPTSPDNRIVYEYLNLGLN